VAPMRGRPTKLTCTAILVDTQCRFDNAKTSVETSSTAVVLASDASTCMMEMHAHNVLLALLLVDMFSSAEHGRALDALRKNSVRGHHQSNCTDGGRMPADGAGRAVGLP
jgi:hypothetical protein